MKPIMDVAYAICGTIFFAIIAVVLTSQGNKFVVDFTVVALLAAGLSQFTVQGTTKASFWLATAFVIIAMFMLGMAIVEFVTSPVTT